MRTSLVLTETTAHRILFQINMAESSKTITTRSRDNNILIGFVRPQLPNGKLPTGGDVLREMWWKYSREITTLMCPQKNKSSEPNCSDNCQAQSDPDMICSVRKIIVCYQKAGIPYMRADHIKRKCKELFEFYRKRVKGKETRNSDGDVKVREDFKRKKLDVMFEVAHSNAEELIKADKKRTEKQKSEDIIFLNEQRTTHRALFVSKNKEFKRKSVLEQEREERTIKRKMQEQARSIKEKERVNSKF